MDGRGQSLVGRVWVREHLTQTRPQEKRDGPCFLAWHPFLLLHGMRSRVAWTVDPHVEAWLEHQTVVTLAKSFDP